MRNPCWRSVAFALIVSLVAGVWTPPPARAASDGGAGNLTLGLAAVVVAVTLIAAWKLDFDKTDDMITYARDVKLSGEQDDQFALVLTDWASADPERSEMVSGLGFRAWF